MPQAYEGLEVIIIDDGSRDSTPEYLDQLKSCSFITIIRNPENRGVNYARNRGIGQASGKFILFLDSDDALCDGSLGKIRDAIKINFRTRHFLFIVSDQVNALRHVTKPEAIQYKDWVTGKISGDFTHVVDTRIMKKYPFFEQFRAYEQLNWLRILKETSPQLLIPLVTTVRERNRPDSLTTAGKLQDVSVIKSKFDSGKLYYFLYHSELRLYNPRALTYRLLETVVLGVACGQKRECWSLIQYAGKQHIKWAGHLFMMVPPWLLKAGIIRYSRFKNSFRPVTAHGV